MPLVLTFFLPVVNLLKLIIIVNLKEPPQLDSTNQNLDMGLMFVCWFDSFVCLSCTGHDGNLCVY